MQKQAPTLGRILVMAGFALSCFGLLLYLWVAFGGGFPLKPKGYRFHVRFGEATQLAQQADVRISGVPVGKVVKLALGPGQTTDATIQLDERYAPIPRDARAILRSKTLLGETFVELTPGHKSDGMLPEDGTLPDAQVSKTVELDEIFRSLDPRTRRSFQVWMQSLAQGIDGRGAGPQRRVRQPRAVRRGHEHAARRARRPAARRSSSSSATPASCSTRSAAAAAS